MLKGQCICFLFFTLIQVNGTLNVLSLFLSSPECLLKEWHVLPGLLKMLHLQAMFIFMFLY